MLLWELLGALSENAKRLPKINLNPKNKIHYINNLTICFKFMVGEGIKLVGIGPEGTVL